MKKVLIIGCSGAGKSTFAKRLSSKTGLPVYHLDLLWWKKDRSTISTDEFDKRLQEILNKEEWIIDGNYKRTLPVRLQFTDTVFFLDYPTDTCLSGVLERLGNDRPDIPWRTDYVIDDEFKNWILDFREIHRPVINKFLQSFTGTIFRFETRAEADNYLNTLI